MKSHAPSSSHPYPVFLSTTTPYRNSQEALVRQMENSLRGFGLIPHALSPREWSHRSPLISVRNLMKRCCGTVVLAMARTWVIKGVTKPHSREQRAFRD